MDPITILKGLNTVGWGNVAKAIRFGFTKLSLERKLQKELKRQARLADPIGELKQAQPINQGLKLVFDDAEAEVTFLAADLLRVTWTPGALPVPYAIAKDDWPPVEVDLAESPEGWCLTTSELTVCIDRQGGMVLTDPQGRELRRYDVPLRAGDGWKWPTSLKADEHIFGLGQRNHALNLRGSAYLIWNQEAMGDYKTGKDPIYVCIPAHLGLHADGAYLAFFENTHLGTFDFGETPSVHFAGGAMRGYFIPGPVPRALDRYTELTGRPAMPPKWALGYHQCRWSYKTEAEALEVLDGFQTHDLPLSALHLDIHYMDGYRVFTVDRERFPDLGHVSDRVHERGAKLVTILDPGVKVDPEYDLYRDGLEHDRFCRQPDGQPVKAPVWPGWCGFPDFTDPEVRAWWGRQYATLTKLGVDGFWHDMNEPAAFSSTGRPTLPLSTEHSLEGRGGNHVEAHNVYALLENRAAFEGLTRLHPERRPWLLTRSGWTGVQRYAWNWTGDTGCNWWSLQHNLRLPLMLGLSGWPYTGSDTGGFNGHPKPELYIRWLQMSAFHPFFRTHSAAFVPRREPWSFGEETTVIARRYMRLRERLMPFWYTLAFEAAQSGAPLVRPLWWTRPEDARLYDIDDAFMLGDALLVAPVVQEGATAREVTLPEGEWLDWWTGERHNGHATLTVAAPLDHLPLFMRAGSLVPSEEGETLTLRLALPRDRQAFDFTLYSDAGDGDGESRLDRFEVVASDEGWTLTRSESGDFPFPYKGIHVECLGDVITETIADGNACAIENNRAQAGAFTICTLKVGA